ncbi:DUF4346 domain-containing protein [archaeon]|jgi:hypothetical protein|nr:DUF4346 domain-containing protein [archaeon]MBT4021753.1 DUF4346 domain-containing protein [archaeon]MBT4271832.1 DUF4346 domain-containing protein [archaeon]MBT4460473.1 DUF4346 domain-containing protein [archaeon]MBT4858493.1 DUF4346 domain-containing protein [archaeon]
MEKINATKSPNCIEIRGEYHPIKDLVLDKFGYLLIRPNKELNLIELGFCKKDNVIEIVISGKTPQDIYKIVCEKNLLAKTDHYAYLGKELQKAYLALKHGLDYVQDEDLILNRN